MRTVVLLALLALFAGASLLAPVAATAAPLPRHRDDGGWRGDRFPGDTTWRFPRHRDRGDREIIIIRERRAPRVITVPVVVPVPVPVLQPIILPALSQVFPNAGFLQNPPSLIPLQPNLYALNSPILFCGVDQLATCQLIADQLSQITPGWGVAIMDGPQGYGAYLTFRSSNL